MSGALYWGVGGQYGPYTAQEDGWPNAGEVMRDYREKLRLKAEEFALLYSEELTKLGKQNKKGKQGQRGKVTGNWILNMEKQNIVPTDMERRRVIAKLLNIPPILFGLASLEEVTLNLQKGMPAQPSALNKSTLQKVWTDIPAYQKNIRVAFRLHNTSQAHNLIHDINADIRDLESLEKQARGDFLYQIRELLVSNNVLASKIVRDRRQYASSYACANNAVYKARQMEDSELLAMTMFTRGSVKLAWGQFGNIDQGRFQVDKGKIDYAIRDFQTILKQAHDQPTSLHPQLQGFTMLQLSCAQSLLKQSQHDPLITNTLTLVDLVADMIECEDIDDLYTRTMVTGALSGLHLGGYLLHRANIFNLLGLPGKALKELHQLKQLAERTYGYDETRNQAWINIVKAETMMGLDEYSEATYTAKNALVACHTIHSTQNVAMIVDLHERLTRSSYGTSEDVKELGDMLKLWYGK